MCDSTSDEYDPCAVDLYTCFEDEEFDMCVNFPSLCGYQMDYDTPYFQPTSENSNQHYEDDDYNVYTCKAVVYESMYELMTLVDSLNYYYDANITANNEFEHDIKMGARMYASLSTSGNDVVNFGESEQNVWAMVPELSIFTNFDEAEDIFDDIFGDDDEEEGDYIDIMGSSYEWTEIWNESTDNFEGYASSSVEFGYKVSEDEDTMLGIMFSIEMPADKLVSGTVIT